MKTELHTADSRGHADHGWLNSYHSFSFANYYNPQRMNFGALRVLNDDTVNGGMGFGAHPHANMEIVSIPLEGDLEHQDSTGRKAIIKNGDIQVMSAGTGITHSEKNANNDREVKFLQIWIIPNRQQVEPRYDQITLDPKDRHNQLQQILSPQKDDEGVWIHQNAWFHLTNMDQDHKLTYEIKQKGNGVYAFVINGKATVAGEHLGMRDALAITEVDTFTLTALSHQTEMLLMEVPMTV
ncbi:pirin family protein [Nonlabens xiamenensis]|uniref:pirin family protein n=1 Tax=Nonlabens xiamenensis TaxID=2341043 RepID=UPI000F60D6AE|nr:pirin family protein [Nonlabens xiamenensis]